MASWEKELNSAVGANDITKVKSILARDKVKKNGNLGRKEWGEYCPLQWAAINGKDDMIKILVAAGMDVNSFRVDGKNLRFTALHLAVNNNQLETVKLLLDLGADMTLHGFATFGNMSGTPLDWAKKEKHTEIIKILEMSVNTKATGLGIARGTDLAFHQLDSLLKLQLKPTKEQELKEAMKIQKELDEKDQQCKNTLVALKQENKNMQTELEMLMKQSQNLQSKINDNINMQKQEETKLQAEANNLKCQPSYKTQAQMKVLRDQLKEIDELANSIRGAIFPNKAECPICMENVNQVFSCNTCDNWVCEKCKGILQTCPNCRQDLEAQPLKRNKTAEKTLGI